MENQSRIVSLSLGSNLGNKEQNIALALDKINYHIGPSVSISDYYKTKPLGFESENNFINCSCIVHTVLTIEELILIIQKIEIEMGRRKLKLGEYEDRIIDIDIIFYDNEIIKNQTINVPHKRFRKREFVLIPLMQISNQIDPETFITVKQFNH